MHRFVVFLGLIWLCVAPSCVQLYSTEGLACPCTVGNKCCEKENTCIPDDEQCPCTPDCSGKQCGDDGCGGTCAPGCLADEECNEAGQCVLVVGEDQDGDSIPDALDNCVARFNLKQVDTDSDGTGDVCDTCDPNDPSCERVLAEFWVDYDSSHSGSVTEVDIYFAYDEQGTDFCGEGSGIGINTFHDGPGVTTFDATNEPTFDVFTGCLTNGVDDWFYTGLEYDTGDTGIGHSESEVGLGTPDLAGCTVDRVVLFVDELVLENIDQNWNAAGFWTWQFWGRCN
jgi:hypothetical protein